MRQSLPEQPGRPAISTLKAVLIGQLVVNLPILLIVLLSFLVGGMLVPEIPWISLIAAIVLGWLWWTFAIRRWRAWALSRGVPPAELTRMAVLSGLARPRDWYSQEESEDDTYIHRS